MEYRITLSIMLVVWLLLTVAIGGIYTAVEERYERRRQEKAYIEYLERQNASLKRTNDFYRTQYDTSELIREAEATEAFNRLKKEAGL